MATDKYIKNTCNQMGDSLTPCALNVGHCDQHLCILVDLKEAPI